MKRLLLIFTLLISGVLMAQTKFSVTASGGSFTSSNIVITVGDTVEWTNVSGTHNVNGTTVTFPSNPASFGNAIGAAWTYTFVFSITGTYNYQCDVHAPNMVGTVIVQPSTGVNEQANKDVVGFYPNPATKRLTFSNAKDINNLAIYSLTGEKVMETNFVKNNIDVSNLTTGIYFVKVITDDGENTTKLIIQ